MGAFPRPWAQTAPTLCFPLGPPKVKAVKKSEHVTEGEGAVLACKSESFPPITEWVWYKVGDTEHQVLTNNSQGKVFVVSTETRTELHILNLDLEADPGQYVCNGSSTEGTGHAVVTLHVRSQLAALWPFLGIVAEVLVLVTVIFIYEKRRKPDEVPDGEPAQPRSGGRRRALWVAGRPPRALPCLSQLGSPPPGPACMASAAQWGGGGAPRAAPQGASGSPDTCSPLAPGSSAQTRTPARRLCESHPRGWAGRGPRAGRPSVWGHGGRGAGRVSAQGLNGPPTPPGRAAGTT